MQIFLDHPHAFFLLPFSLRHLKLIYGDMCRAIGGFDLDNLELHLVQDSHIAILNSQHMGCTSPTNVLTFPGDYDLGSFVFLSLDTFRRETVLYGQNPGNYLIRLLAHSCGHLGGLEHGIEMSIVEERCFNAGMAIACKPCKSWI